MKAFPMGDFSPMLRPHPSVVRNRTRPSAGEVDQLRATIDQLQSENRELRGEITRLRLFQALDVPAQEDSEDAESPLPDDARKLYVVLPRSFSQIAFFKMAYDLGFSVERSQKIVGLLLRHRFLERVGEELRKSDPYQYRLPLKR
ncbi:MAG: hypothetical protein R2834_16680 [Rhodothermales bacterium]